MLANSFWIKETTTRVGMKGTLHMVSFIPLLLILSVYDDRSPTWHLTQWTSSPPFYGYFIGKSKSNRVQCNTLSHQTTSTYGRPRLSICLNPTRLGTCLLYVHPGLHNPKHQRMPFTKTTKVRRDPSHPFSVVQVSD